MCEYEYLNETEIKRNQTNLNFNFGVQNLYKK